MKIFFTLLLFTFVLINPQAVSAHVLKTDGSIGAILHVDPNDAPTVGKQSSIYFDLKDKNNKFKLENCDCTASVSRNNTELFSHPHSDDSPIPFIFPEKGVYTIAISGKPTSGDSFKPFSLEWDVRVEGSETTLNFKLSQIIFFSSIFLGVLFCVGVFWFTKTARKNSNAKKISSWLVIGILTTGLISIHATKMFSSDSTHQHDQKADHNCCLPKSLDLEQVFYLPKPPSSTQKIVEKANPLHINKVVFNLSNKSPPGES